ncbi:leucyl aminopeptidase [Pseudactinotalea sp. Z1732]|uniref:leucyl aminopeptidase n=1 Tax=Pseudactinotalea sp. Z1732 TaxID=3413026 RepID=UPI003C7E4546
MTYVTELTLTSKSPVRLPADALVIPVYENGGSASLLANPALDDQVRAALAGTIELLDISGEPGKVTRVPAPEQLAATTVAFTGLGEVDGQPDAEQIRRAAGSAVRELEGAKNIALLFGLEDAESTGAVTEGALLGAYRFTRYKKDVPTPAQIVVICGAAKQKAVKDAVERARILAQGVNATRDLVNTSPKDLYPESFAETARGLVKGTKVGIEVLDEKALRAGGYGGLLGVGQGSDRGPRLVTLTYKPAKAKTHYALVGKGITFDSGGLSIKPAKGMETMKLDMAGAAAVLHTVLAAAELKLPIAVTGYLALAENMPSGTAQRPSDVIEIRGGKTVEVLNTDAEGRLVLADALVAATEAKADLIVDIATLTGAQMVALGNQVSAVMGTDDAREQVVAAASTSGEQFWPMPLPGELRPSLKSTVADLANIGDRFGGMLTAGLFLQEFVGDTPWAHLDIAGPAFNEASPRHYVPKGGTGVGVRTMLRLLEDAANA